MPLIKRIISIDDISKIEEMDYLWNLLMVTILLDYQILE